MSGTYSVISDRCELPACDEQKRAIICGKPATTTRTTFDVTFSACEACALAIDARDAKAAREPLGTVPPHAGLAAMVDRAHGRRAPGTVRMRRIVLRMPAADVARVDALRARFKVPRADLLRAFVLFGLAAAEETAATPKDGAP